MNEAEVRMQAEMYALVADMNAFMIGVEAMKAANIVRLDGGYPLAYDDISFLDERKNIERIALRLRTEI